MEVICPSYGRTGTKSLQLALDLLGFGPCYHMYNVLANHMGTHPQLWLDGYQGRGLPVKQLFDGYRSVTDCPAADFYKEIMREYPNAKIVVTLRDPDSWVKSVHDTVHSNSSNARWWGRFFTIALYPAYRRWTYMLRHIPMATLGEEEAKVDYIRHNAEVKAHVPADKLLEFSVKDGWEPLCSFLGVPVPDVPFPKTNSREEIVKFLQRANTLGWMLMMATIAAAGVSVGMASWLGGKRTGGVVAAVEICALSSCFMEALKASRFQVAKRE